MIREPRGGGGPEELGQLAPEGRTGDDGHRLVKFIDVPAFEPPLKEEIPLSHGGHGWVGFSLDGAYGWCHTPDVIDVETKHRVARLEDSEGNPVDGSKFFEAHSRGSDLVRVGKQFATGRKHLAEG